MEYRGIVEDDLRTLETRRTRWYSTYEEAHKAAEMLCLKTMGNRGSVDIESREAVRNVYEVQTQVRRWAWQILDQLGKMPDIPALEAERYYPISIEIRHINETGYTFFYESGGLRVIGAYDAAKDHLSANIVVDGAFEYQVGDKPELYCYSIADYNGQTPPEVALK